MHLFFFFFLIYLETLAANLKFFTNITEKDQLPLLIKTTFALLIK